MKQEHCPLSNWPHSRRSWDAVNEFSSNVVSQASYSLYVRSWYLFRWQQSSCSSDTSRTVSPPSGFPLWSWHQDVEGCNSLANGSVNSSGPTWNMKIKKKYIEIIFNETVYILCIKLCTFFRL